MLLPGNPDAVKENGQAARLYQGFWSASDKDIFNELYGYTQDILRKMHTAVRI